MLGCTAAALASSTAFVATASSWWAAVKRIYVEPESTSSNPAAARTDVAHNLATAAGSRDIPAAVVASGIFRKTESEVMCRLIGHMRPVRFGPGHVAFAQGDPEGALYVITSGKVKVVYRHPGGREVVLNVLGASDIFGEVTPFDCGPREVTAIALTEVDAVAIERHQLLEWITECPEVINQIGRLLARRADVMNDCLIDFACTDPTYRITRRLLLLGKRFGQKEGDVVRVAHGLTPEEVALFAGVDRETVAATLRDFGNRGWIRFTDGCLVIVDGHALASLCAQGNCD
jgi:CRP/FNR family cyclic AMP-dependent transcriptional regulator